MRWVPPYLAGRSKKENSLNSIQPEKKDYFSLVMLTLFDVKIIQIWTFPAASSTERVPSLAERITYLRYAINLRLFNWRVPALFNTYLMD